MRDANVPGHHLGLRAGYGDRGGVIPCESGGGSHARREPDPLPPVRPAWASVLAIVFASILIILMWRAMH